MSAAATATATAPATVANLGPGFDLLGLALNQPRDRVIATCREVPGIALEVEGLAAQTLPTDPQQNTAGVAAAWVLERGGADFGVHLHLRKGLPVGSGLGSSAASAVAAALATNALLPEPLPRPQLLTACRLGEERVTGSPHPDNVAPALFGGLVLCRPAAGIEDGLPAIRVRKLPLVNGLFWAVVRPNVQVATAAARQALPQALALGSVVRQTGYLAGLIAACYEDDADDFLRCLQDELAEPARAPLVPGLARGLEAIRAQGVAGGIAGSGPTAFLVAKALPPLEEAAHSFMDQLELAGLSSSWQPIQPDPVGGRVERTG